jgi:DNA-binding PadR family transcriptional regulator
MSVSMSLLAMLDERPMYGLELKNTFEESTGGVWPLNVGQVYTTISRLERDGMVSLAEEADGQKLYAITDAGREEIAGWFRHPSRGASATRDEIVLKISLAVLKPTVDVAAVIQSERRALLEELQQYTRFKADPPTDKDLSWAILLDSIIFKIEARVRWLDACETRIARSGRPGIRTTSQPADSEVRT